MGALFSTHQTRERFRSAQGKNKIKHTNAPGFSNTKTLAAPPAKTPVNSPRYA